MESGTRRLEKGFISAPKTKKHTFLAQKQPQRKNDQLFGKSDLALRPAFVAPLYQQIKTTPIMKIIQTIIEDIKSFFNPAVSNKQPELNSINQKHFCDSLAITEYYCDENNLFI
jgi:hypothetical protein